MANTTYVRPYGGTVTIVYYNNSTQAVHRECELCKALIKTSRFLKDHINAWRGTEPPRLYVNYNSQSFVAFVFDAYDRWLYTQEVLTNVQMRTGSPDARSNFGDLINYWMFGGSIKDSTFQDMVSSAFIERLRATPSGARKSFLGRLSPTVIAGLYQGVPAGSPLRRLIVHALACYLERDAIARFRGESKWPKKFLEDLMLSAFDERDRRTSQSNGSSKKVSFGEPESGGNECIYHLHGPHNTCWRDDQ
jgi:hypothetical protein